MFSKELDFQRVKLNKDIDYSIELDRFSLVEQLNLKKCEALLSISAVTAIKFDVSFLNVF